jgi:hypothetical protein
VGQRREPGPRCFPPTPARMNGAPGRAIVSRGIDARTRGSSGSIPPRPPRSRGWVSLGAKGTDPVGLIVSVQTDGSHLTDDRARAEIGLCWGTAPYPMHLRSRPLVVSIVAGNGEALPSTITPEGRPRLCRVGGLSLPRPAPMNHAPRRGIVSRQVMIWVPLCRHGASEVRGCAQGTGSSARGSDGWTPGARSPGSPSLPRPRFDSQATSSARSKGWRCSGSNNESR